MLTKADLYPSMTVNHIKTGNEYCILAIAKLKSDQWVECVIYYRVGQIELYVRKLDDFCEAFQ